VSYPAPSQEVQSPVEPVEPAKVTGASESKVAGLTTLPDKRPSRRFFGLLPGRRGM
jgi:hypothetical protein